MEFTFTDYLWWKLIILGGIAFFGNFIFTLMTGRTIEEVLRDKE